MWLSIENHPEFYTVLKILRHGRHVSCPQSICTEIAVGEKSIVNVFFFFIKKESVVLLVQLVLREEHVVWLVSLVCSRTTEAKIISLLLLKHTNLDMQHNK